MPPVSASSAHRAGRTPPERVGLVALDLDGTVLSPAGHVTPRTRAAIRALIDAGVNVCIATGRTWWESKAVIHEGQLLGPGVFAGGALINDMPTGESLSRTRMNPVIAREICHHIDACGLSIMVMQDRCEADVEWLISAEVEMAPTVPQWLARHSSSFRQVEGLRAAEHAGTVRISTVGYRTQTASLVARLAGAMGDSIYLHEITVPSAEIAVVEVFDASVNKWTGVQRVAGLLGVDERSVVAIGDDMNDLHMLRHARIGVAMGNARPEVKAVADLVIGSNAHDGLAQYLEALVKDDARL